MSKRQSGLDERSNGGSSSLASDNKARDVPPANKTLLGNLRISTKIAILAGLALIGMSVLGGVYVVGDSRTYKALATEEAYVAFERQIIGAQLSALQMRRREKDFMLRKDLKYVEKYRADFKQAMTRLEGTEAFDFAGNVSEQIRKVRDGLARHQAQFTKFVDMLTAIGLNENEGLKGQLRASVHAVEAKLKDLNLPDLMVTMLMMRRHEKDFMMRKSETYLGKMTSRFDEFTAQLETQAIPPEAKKEILTLVKQYQSDFGKFAEATLAMIAETKKLSTIYADFNPILKALVQYSEVNLDAAMTTQEEVKSSFETTILIAGLTVATLFIILSVLLARSISRPIRTITDAMTALAGGDVSVVMPASGDKNEIGEMTRSMIVLRNEVAKAYNLVATLEGIGASQAMIEFETDGTIITANRNFLATLGYELSEVEGKHHSMFVDPTYKGSPEYRQFWDDLRSGKFRAGEMIRVNKSGEEVWLQAAYNPVLDDHGKTYKVVKNAVDITENKVAALRMVNKVSEVVDNVASTATEMQQAAETMASTAEETSRQSQAAAAASEQASTNVQTVSAAAEEMSSSVNEIARQVAHSATMAKEAVVEAQSTNVSMQGLSDNAEKIGEVVDLISDIASQTNLLALNATIEAARAGDAGKGFAVVASEVKSLATQTAKATEQIAAQIGAIQSATEESVAAIGSIDKKIGEMDEVTTAIASAIEEQGAATGEISNNSQQAALGTQEVSSNVAGVQQAAAETGAAASQVLSATGELANQANILRKEIEEFLTQVRAA